MLKCPRIRPWSLPLLSGQSQSLGQYLTFDSQGLTIVWFSREQEKNTKSTQKHTHNRIMHSHESSDVENHLN